MSKKNTKQSDAAKNNGQDMNNRQDQHTADKNTNNAQNNSDCPSK